MLAANASLLDLTDDVACIAQLQKFIIVVLEYLDGYIIENVPAFFEEQRKVNV